MTTLTRYIETISDKSRLALAATGILATLMGAPSDALAGNFLDRLKNEFAGGVSGRTYAVDDVRTAAAFNLRISDNLSDLVDLSRSMQRIDLYGQFSGIETASKIKTAYLYEYSRAPYAELRQYDRLMLSVAPGVRDRRVEMIVSDANRKKAVLRDGTTLVDEIANALKYEDYRLVERMVAQFSHMMESRAVPLLQGQRRGDAMAYAEEGVRPPFGR